MCIYIYIYVERERDSERERCTRIICIYIYIHIYTVYVCLTWFQQMSAYSAGHSFTGFNVIQKEIA